MSQVADERARRAFALRRVPARRYCLTRNPAEGTGPAARNFSLRPVRASRVLTANTPKSRSSTRSPRASAAVMVSLSCGSTATATLLLGRVAAPAGCREPGRGRPAYAMGYAILAGLGCCLGDLPYVALCCVLPSGQSGGGQGRCHPHGAGELSRGAHLAFAPDRVRLRQGHWYREYTSGFTSGPSRCQRRDGLG